MMMLLLTCDRTAAIILVSCARISNLFRNKLSTIFICSCVNQLPLHDGVDVLSGTGFLNKLYVICHMSHISTQ